MSGAIFRRGLAEGWRSLLIVAVCVGAMMLLALWAYREIDLGIYEALPAAVRAVMGIPASADASLMAYNVMLGSVGGLAVVGVAIAVGARAVAGEEEARTLHLVLAAPVSRLRFAALKAAANVVLLALTGVLLWAIAALAPLLLGTEQGEAHVDALMIHLISAALFHGTLAFGVGAATGRRALASSVAVLVMVLGWLASGVLPMWREGAADAIPWHWLNGSYPLVNGVQGGDVALLLGGAALWLVLGTLGFQFRELRLRQAESSLLGRLRSTPQLAKVLVPAGGKSLFGLRMAAGRALTIVVVYVVAIMGVALPFMYSALRDVLGGFAVSFPKAMLQMFGGGDEILSPAGFLQVEIFGMIAPAGVILLGIAASAAGIAGEEQKRRLSLTLSLPTSRGRVYLTTACAMGLQVLIAAAALFAAVLVGCRLAGVHLDTARLATACLLVMLLGWCFGALALTLSAGTGHSSLTVWVSTALAVASYFGHNLLSVIDKAEYAWWSPFRAYLAGPPLMHDVSWWQPVWLIGATVVFVAAGLPLFQRRDLRLR